jgi:hypothetical protein
VRNIPLGIIVLMLVYGMIEGEDVQAATIVSRWDEDASDTVVTIEAENAYVPLLPLANGIAAVVDALPAVKLLAVYVALIFET